MDGCMSPHHDSSKVAMWGGCMDDCMGPNLYSRKVDALEAAWVAQ